MGLEAGIWASRLGFGPQGWVLGLEARGDIEDGEEGEISPYVKA